MILLLPRTEARRVFALQTPSHGHPLEPPGSPRTLGCRGARLGGRQPHRPTFTEPSLLAQAISSRPILLGSGHSDAEEAAPGAPSPARGGSYLVPSKRSAKLCPLAAAEPVPAPAPRPSGRSRRPYARRVSDTCLMFQGALQMRFDHH